MVTRRDAAVAAILFAAATMAGCSCGHHPDSGTVRLSSPSGSAVVSLKGGRILSWKDASGRELFFMPAKKESPGGDWSHGGTSLCWPWFGRKGTEPSMIHGFARNRMFSLRGRQKVDGGESVTLGLEVSGSDNANFPHDADVELSVVLTDRLVLKLKTANLGDAPFEITEGFQSYFPVSGYDKIVFSGIEKDDFAAVDGMDKAFRRLPGDFGFKDTSRGCELKMKAAGNSGLVVWTPGKVEPANRNLAPDDCPKFVVLGPSCRAAEGAVTVKPGESHELVCELSFR